VKFSKLCKKKKYSYTTLGKYFRGGGIIPKCSKKNYKKHKNKIYKGYGIYVLEVVAADWDDNTNKYTVLKKDDGEMWLYGVGETGIINRTYYKTVKKAVIKISNPERVKKSIESGCAWNCGWKNGPGYNDCIISDNVQEDPTKIINRMIKDGEKILPY